MWDYQRAACRPGPDPADSLLQVNPDFPDQPATMTASRNLPNAAPWILGRDLRMCCIAHTQRDESGSRCEGIRGHGCAEPG